MAVYTVHAPARSDADLGTAPDKLVFVRDGFYVWAFLAAPVWLIWHRLWLALAGYIALMIAGDVATSAAGSGLAVRLVVMAVIALLIGLEAGTLRRWKLSRGIWRQFDIVAADSEEAAERRFFERWNNRSTADHARTGISTPPPLPRVSASQSQGIVGLFPESGASR